MTPYQKIAEHLWAIIGQQVYPTVLKLDNHVNFIADRVENLALCAPEIAVIIDRAWDSMTNQFTMPPFTVRLNVAPYLIAERNPARKEVRIVVTCGVENVPQEPQTDVERILEGKAQQLQTRPRIVEDLTANLVDGSVTPRKP